MDRLKELLQEVVDEASSEANSIKGIVRDLLYELSDMTYWLKPCESDYYYVGVTEAKILDTKKEIAEDLTKLYEKYQKMLDEMEQSYAETKS